LIRPLLKKIPYDFSKEENQTSVISRFLATNAL